MFTNKHDSLVDSVKIVMEKNELRRRVEDALNEELGISSRKAVPHEHLASYDAMLEEAYKCAMKEADEKDYSGDYHILTPDGKNTVLVTNSKEDATKTAQRFGKGYKVYPSGELPDTWEGAGVGGRMFPGKKKTVKEDTPISHSNQTIISKQDGKPASISGEDLAILRAKKKAGEKIKQEETQLDEKAVSKAQHRFFGLVRGIQKGKAHGSAKAEKAAEEMSAKEVRKFAKTKEKGLPERVDESLESIMEEIRNNLEEKLVAVYESGDAQLFEEFVSSLTEEQLELLGLCEMGLGTSVFGDLGAQAAANLANRPARAARPAPATRPSAPTAAPTARPSAAPTAAPAQAARPAPAPAVTPPGSKPTGAQFGPRQSPSDMGAPPAGSPQYISTSNSMPGGRPATATGPGRADLTEPTAAAGIERSFPKAQETPASKAAAQGNVAYDRPTFDDPNRTKGVGDPERRRTNFGGAARSSGSPGQPNVSIGPNATQQQPSQPSRQETGGRLGAEIPESYHIKESLESMIRSKYLKG